MRHLHVLIDIHEAFRPISRSLRHAFVHDAYGAAPLRCKSLGDNSAEDLGSLHVAC